MEKQIGEYTTNNRKEPIKESKEQPIKEPKAQQMMEEVENQEIWSQEQRQFQMCRELIQKNIANYEKQAEDFHSQVETLYKAVQSGDVELYNQLIVTQSMEEHVKNQLKKNRFAAAQPYFGRINYQSAQEKTTESVYIGKNGVFRDKTTVVIADWRAPIATVYYENELGMGSYLLPDGRSIEIDLQLKRTFDVTKGELKGYYDSDVASTDELLVQYLSKNKDVVLGDIIASIQKEQNEIIRTTPYTNTIVQGVAGSGKTTVAMHRISYILYNYQEAITSNEFCIIGSNDVLLNYITGGLPELDVPNIKQKRMDQILIHLLEKNWKKSYRVKEASKEAGWKSRIFFMRELETYLDSIRNWIIPPEEVRDEELGILLSKENNTRTLQENKDASIYQLLNLLDERLKSRIRFRVPDHEKEILKRKTTEYKQYYKKRKAKENITDLYLEFLQYFSRKNQLEIMEDIQEIIDGRFDVFDLAALVLIRKRVTQKKENEEFGQLFVDEAQDFGSAVYYALRKALPKCYFTIMGDVSQNIHYETGMNDWEDMRNYVFNSEKDTFRMLSKSYRNTIEISEYAGAVLEKASAGQYRIEPVIRHGKPVEIRKDAVRDSLLSTAVSLIGEIKSRGFDTIAVVCEDEQEASKVQDELQVFLPVSDGSKEGFQRGVMVLPVSLTKGLEFDAVLLWNPDLEAVDLSPAKAKLQYVAITRALHELYLLILS